MVEEVHQVELAVVVQLIVMPAIQVNFPQLARGINEWFNDSEVVEQDFDDRHRHPEGRIREA